MAGEFRLQDLDRGQMERERLARLAQKRGFASTTEADAPSDPISKRVKTTPIETPPITAQDSKARRTREASHITKQDANKHDVAKSLEDSVTTTKATSRPLSYPQGRLLRTWAFRHERSNDIKIEEVIDKHNLTTGIFSSYCVDPEWLLSKLRVDKTKIVLVLHERQREQQRKWQEEAARMGPQFEVLFPTLSTPYGCMHSKLMLLFYGTHLRIAVPSANLIAYDWGETGVMENTVFVIDLPRLPEVQQGSSNSTLTQFSSDLLYFIKAQGMSQAVQDAVVNRFDFTATKSLAFVATVHGQASGNAIHRTGFPALAKAVQRLGLAAPQGPIEIDATASSIGALNAKFLHSLQKAVAGIDTLIPTRAPSKDEQSTRQEDIKVPSPLDPKHFRIFFPSQDSVRNSTGGAMNGGTLFLKPSYWADESFPRSLFRDQKIKRTGLLSHSKLLIVRSAQNAFLYSGSANLSQSAWGNVSWDRKAKAAKYFAQNWECGVVVPVKTPVDEADVSTASEGESETDSETDAANTAPATGNVLPMSVFDGKFVVPFDFPGKAYDRNQRPWDATTDLP